MVARSISNPINAVFPIQGSAVGVQNAVTAVIGRFSQYSGNFIFDQRRHVSCRQARRVSANLPRQEYDVYGQDSWKITPHLTLTYGLRYTISTPVYETNGFEVRTDIPLSEVFQPAPGSGSPWREF